MKKLFTVLVICFAIFLILPIFVSASPLAFNTERISGQDRIETAIGIAQKGWTSAQSVILCEYRDYPDSIAATPFAASLDAPILLTGGDSLDQRVVRELRRLNPQKVFLLGGQGCLKASIEAELEELSLPWERIGGRDRYETSVLLARKLNSDTLIIANGDNFPDALSAASYAGNRQIPIVLTSKTMPACVLEYCHDTQPGHIIVIGGEGAVPTESLTNNNLSVGTRLGGKDRYDTNSQVVAYMQNEVQTDDLFLASGMTFADAVAGTVLASKFKAPLILTEKDDIPPAVYSIMRGHMKVEPPSAVARSGRGKVTASVGLNLRDTPSSAGKVILTIPDGTMLDITSAQGQWYKTTYQNKTGWVSASYVTMTEVYKQGKIMASGGLNLRENPSTAAKVLTIIPQGTIVAISGDRPEWYKASYRGQAGWIYAEYVTVLGNGADNANIDLSPNGKVYILGGDGVISLQVQRILEGKSDSKYPDNLKDFPALPTSLSGSDSSVYSPEREILLDPFEGIAAGVLHGKNIMIDPGHGGPDSGAIGPSNTFEKDNNLAIALYLKDILTEAGAVVSMTRETDTCVAANYSESADLQARVNMANNKADILISIHNNANSNPDFQGTTTYYSEQSPGGSESRRLAAAVQNSMVRKLNTCDEGVKSQNFYILRNTTIPSVLIEVAYISNPNEEARLNNPVFQKNAATAIFHGIYDYYLNN